MNEREFRKLAADDGYGEVRPVIYEPNQRPDMHTHEFSAMVLLTEGGLTMAYEGGADDLGPGDLCVVEAGTVHSEQAGPDGGAGLLALRSSGVDESEGTQE